MNTISESRAEPREQAPHRKILVWDAPVRLFHWLMVASFAGAWLTAESEPWRLVHVTLGYTMAGLVLFRILWGLWGTRYAKFSSFVRGPTAVAGYVANLLRGRHVPHTGHNPAGAIAILALLGLTLLVTFTGWVTYNDFAGGWLEEAHEAAANVMLAIVGAHVAAVIWTSWRFRENLVGAMITGRKPGKPEEGIARPWRGLGAVMLVAVLGFWCTQWLAGPAGDVGRASGQTSIVHDRHQHGDGD
jgi:cytochrome b